MMSEAAIRELRKQHADNLERWREPDGLLVPTEPDADERYRVRARLCAAIDTCDRILGELDPLRRRELIGEWKVRGQKYLAAVALWVKYDQETDDYDLCRGAVVSERGEVGPPPQMYRAASNLYARDARSRMLRAGLDDGITDEGMTAAANSTDRERAALRNRDGSLKHPPLSPPERTP
jgi:hypothetical protein